MLRQSYRMPTNVMNWSLSCRLLLHTLSSHYWWASRPGSRMFCDLHTATLPHQSQQGSWGCTRALGSCKSRHAAPAHIVRQTHINTCVVTCPANSQFHKLNSTQMSRRQIARITVQADFPYITSWKMYANSALHHSPTAVKAALLIPSRLATDNAKSQRPE